MLLYDKITVIDIEATCWEDEKPPENQEREIIEIGICKLNLSDGSIEDKRSYFVKPYKSEVSEYCTKLTGITAEKLEKEGISFQEACSRIKNRYNSLVRTYSGYGGFDKEIIENQCRELGTRFPFSDTYIDLKILISLMKGEKPKGLLKELQIRNLEFEGNNHSGADDAYNTAKLLYHVLRK
ncbi:3'-5' exonuclease [Chryseobacterium sp. BIGb0232]|uniref:3'-5' exonuclease n=1 Tax=Chryseobacterium sp. BIGb0232 TaxID=2940598 RepID=UPI000F47AFF0|nr:3'-5' exonuclease [Chryseobacterium sp. BIGb0232]MCS4305116.1 inhibitor of KinA sporulation pathway (predicted exonuclease) [Chryseobacterium sp. BIGb0232]ROS07732.1 inhibitor of KinA sporulation pathway (predicted exonuclease) [Chryseobacterium nakagawai]